MARTKNRFNAVQIPEAVTAGVPVKQRKSFRVALYARLSVELKSRPSESIANQLSILREFIRDKAENIKSMLTVQCREPVLTDRYSGR